MSERRQDIHVHVERDEPAYRDEPVVRDDPVYRDDRVMEEEARATSFFSAQILWILLIAVVIVLIVAALGSGVVDLGGSNGATEPTAVP